MHVTFFPNQHGTRLDAEDIGLTEIAAIAQSTRRPAKADLPWIKCARFGTNRTEKGSLRNNANILEITGVEGDYDAERMNPEEAVEKLTRHGIHALIYTSPSHRPDKPRWRVIAPLSAPMPPAMRGELIGRINHALGGVLAGESFTLSQSYYIGGVLDGQPVETHIVPGRRVDQVELAPRYPERKRTEPIVLPPAPPGQEPDDRARQALTSAVAAFETLQQDRHATILAATSLTAPFVKSGHLDQADVIEKIHDACTASGREPNPGEVEGALIGAMHKVAAYTPADGSEFGGVAPDIAPASPPPRRFAHVFRPGVVTVEPREWVYGGHYIRKFLSATVAPGGLGKSSLALVEALDMATGLGLLSGRPTSQRYRVVYWNGEDPLEETLRRLEAACRQYRITADAIGDRLIVASGRDVPLRIAQDTPSGFMIAEPLADELIAELRAGSVDVLMLDPFVKTHGVNENDNNRVDAVASQFARIADLANCAVELVHHVRKSTVPGQDRTAEDARGGVALISAARSVRVLNVMQAPEAEQLGISDDDRRRCFRVDDGKVNLVPPRGTQEHATWRHLASVTLDNARPDRGLAADNVGVVTPWVKPAVGDQVTAEHLADMARRFTAGEPNRRDVQSPRWAGHTVAAALQIEMVGPAERKRVGKIMDALIGRGELIVGTVLDDKRRPRAIVEVSAPPAPPPGGAGVEQRGAATSTIHAPPPEHGGVGVVGAHSTPPLHRSKNPPINGHHPPRSSEPWPGFSEEPNHAAE